MLERLLGIILPVFAVVALGWFWGRRTQPDMAIVNRLSMNVLAPALIFSALSSKSFDLWDNRLLILGSIGIVLGSGLLAWPFAKLLHEDHRTFVPPMMFNNCGNLGLPLAVLAFGEPALAPAVVMFMVSNLLHFTYGAWLLDHRIKVWTVWKVPSVIATVAGLVVGILGIQVWPPLMLAIRMLGEIAIPLMLFALGVRLTDSKITAVGIGVFGAVARPLVGMMLALGVMMFIDLPPQERALLLVFGALPPAVLNFIFAERYHQQPEVVASMVLIGNVSALVFLSAALAISLP